MTITITSIQEDRKEEWNTLVSKEAYFSLFQSWEWGEFKADFGWLPIRLGVEQNGELVAGAQLLIKPFPLNLASIAYIPRGPIGSWLDQTISPDLIAAIIQVAKQHRAALVRFEPGIQYDTELEKQFKEQNFRPSYSNQPQATLVLDLHEDPEDILASFHQKTRYNIRYAKRKGVEVRTGGLEDFNTLMKMMAVLEKRSGLFKARDIEYYQSEWKAFAPEGKLKLFVAEYEGEPLAVNVSIFFGKHAAYFHGASINAHRNLMPNHLLMWEAIKWAKSQGCLTYDFWGIPEEVGQEYYQSKSLPTSTRTDGLWGVYRFKRGFTEQVVYFMNALDVVCKPALYPFAKLAERNITVFESLAALFDSFRPNKT